MFNKIITAVSMFYLKNFSTGFKKFMEEAHKDESTDKRTKRKSTTENS